MKLLIETVGLSAGKDMIKKMSHEALVTVVLNTDIDSSYGYRLDIGTIYFITGRTQQENELPFFSLPLQTKNVLGKDVGILDVRDIVKNTKEDYSDIFMYAKDVNQMKARIIAAFYLLKFKTALEQAEYLKKTAMTMSGFLTYLIKDAMALDMDTTNKLNVLLTYCVYTLYDPEKSMDERVYLATNSTVYGKSDDETLKRYLNTEIKIEKITDIVTVINSAGLNERLNRFSVTVLIDIIKGGLFGVEAGKRMLVATESLPVWMGILYEALTNRYYEKMPVGNFLRSFKRTLALEDFVNAVNGDVDGLAKKLSQEGYQEEGLNNIDGSEKEDEKTEKATSLKVLRSSSFTLFWSEDKYKLIVTDIGGLTEADTNIIEILNTAKNDSKLLIEIESNGGSLMTSIKYINVILDVFTRDNITTVLNPNAYSAGSLFFEIGSTRIIYPISSIMYHQFSTFAFGTGEKIKQSVALAEDLYYPLFKRLIIDTGHMTDEEYKAMMNGKDIFKNSKEMIERGIATHIMTNRVAVPREKYIS
jgi:ATP-dependent protease ClpP protease subunit/CBS domain-containing protein